jgi:hypothetical protein
MGAADTFWAALGNGTPAASGAGLRGFLPAHVPEPALANFLGLRPGPSRQRPSERSAIWFCYRTSLADREKR